MLTIFKPVTKKKSEIKIPDKIITSYRIAHSKYSLVLEKVEKRSEDNEVVSKHKMISDETHYIKRNFDLVEVIGSLKKDVNKLCGEGVEEHDLCLFLKGIELNSDSHLSEKLICFNESPLKTMKNGFLFHLKSSRYLDFCLGFLVMYKKRLD